MPSISGWFNDINQILIGSRKIELTDFDARIEIDTNDEFNEIATQFNKMADTLKRTTTSREKLIAEVESRKKAQQALSESEVKFRGLFENSLVGISLSTDQGEYLQVNEAYAKMLGYDSPEEVVSCISDISTQVWVS